MKINFIPGSISKFSFTKSTFAFQYLPDCTISKSSFSPFLPDRFLFRCKLYFLIHPVRLRFFSRVHVFMHVRDSERVFFFQILPASPPAGLLFFSRFFLSGLGSSHAGICKARCSFTLSSCRGIHRFSWFFPRRHPQGYCFFRILPAQSRQFLSRQKIGFRTK